MEDCNSVKLRIVGFDCAGIERQVTYWASLIVFSPALSQARRGPTHPVTVMFYTPRGHAATIALQPSGFLGIFRRMRGRAVESYFVAIFEVRQQTAVFL